MEFKREFYDSYLAFINDVNGNNSILNLYDNVPFKKDNTDYFLTEPGENGSLIKNGMSPSIFELDIINAAINSEAILLITDKNGYILYLNNNCCRNVGYRQEELLGKHTRIFKTGIHSKEFYQKLWETVLSGQIWKGEMSAKRKDGGIVWNFLTIFPILDDHHQPYQFLTLRLDITELKKLELEAAQKDKRLNAIAKNAAFAIGSFDQNGEITFLNEVFSRDLGYSNNDGIGQSIFNFIAEESLAKTKRILAALMRSPGKSVRTEVIIKSKKGMNIWYDVSATNYLHEPLLNEIIFTAQNITKQKTILEEAKRMAFFDYLTGLPNRRNFVYNLKKELVCAEKTNSDLAVFLLDIDEFKYVNDSFGHVVGDQLLRDVSIRMKKVFTDEAFIARLGGDEFALLEPDISNAEDVHKLAEKLTLLISIEPFHIEGNEFYITASVGVSLYPHSGNTMESLLKHADMAMYRAKHCGKNQFQIFSPNMNLYSYKQFTLRNDSKKALTNDEFTIYIQPRYDPFTDTIAGGEALIRWNHPKWGMVSPEEFISMAEESGLIVPIGEWMLRRVCRKLKEWQTGGIRIKKVSINLTALELLQSTFIDKVSTAIKESNLDPKWIEFEITERMIIDKENMALKTLSRLKDMGISVALDDFGTGYSAINYLWKFPCDVIKIDKSIIKDMQKDNASYEVVSAIINLCKKLNKIVVAEGVETRKQLELLKKLGCNEIQGYYYSRPVEEEQFAELLKAGTWVQENPKDTISFENKRQFFRVLLHYPLEADMTIERIGFKKIDIGSSKVLVEDIGPGGLRFISMMKLPIKEDIILSFTTEIFSGVLKINGHIVWSRELDEEIFQYGVKFTINEAGREGLIKILHQLQVSLKDSSIITNGRFISEEKLSYIKKLKEDDIHNSSKQIF